MNTVKDKVSITDARNNDLLKELFFEQNMGLVYNVAHDFKNSLEFDELIGIGQFGLLKAFNSFDTKYNLQFSTYALKVINNEVLMELRKIRNKNKRFKTQSIDTKLAGTKDDEMKLEDILSSPEKDFNLEDFDALAHVIEYFTLKEDEKVVKAFKMFVLEDKSTKEIADEFGIGQSGGSRMATRAVKAFQKAAIELGVVDCHNKYYKRTKSDALKKEKERDNAIRAKILYALINFPQLSHHEISQILGYDSYKIALMKASLNKGKDFKLKPDSSIEPILEIYLEKKKIYGY